jgi:hypothetical protein
LPQSNKNETPTQTWKNSESLQSLQGQLQQKMSLLLIMMSSRARRISSLCSEEKGPVIRHEAKISRNLCLMPALCLGQLKEQRNCHFPRTCKKAASNPTNSSFVAKGHAKVCNKKGLEDVVVFCDEPVPL